MAIAPPLGLTLDSSIPSLRVQYSAWEAKASLISQMPTSVVSMPTCSSSLGIATAGPTPISSGAQPATELATQRALMEDERPSSVAVDRRINRVAAAPSLTCELFPAVLLPVAEKAGFRLAIFSTEMLWRIPSSLVTVTSFGGASGFSGSNESVFTGTISESKRPAFWAAVAFLCDSAAKTS